MAALRPARAWEGSRRSLRRAQFAPPGMARSAACAVAAWTWPGAGREAKGRAAVSSPGGPGRYEIRVDAVLDERWGDWFGGLQVSSDGRQTVISGLLPDQPALHGLLAKIRDLGLSLISVRRLDAGDGAQ